MYFFYCVQLCLRWIGDRKEQMIDIDGYEDEDERRDEIRRDHLIKEAAEGLYAINIIIKKNSKERRMFFEDGTFYEEAEESARNQAEFLAQKSNLKIYQAALALQRKKNRQAGRQVKRLNSGNTHINGNIHTNDDNHTNDNIATNDNIHIKNGTNVSHMELEFGHRLFNFSTSNTEENGRDADTHTENVQDFFDAEIVQNSLENNENYQHNENYENYENDDKNENGRVDFGLSDGTRTFDSGTRTIDSSMRTRMSVTAAVTAAALYTENIRQCCDIAECKSSEDYVDYTVPVSPYMKMRMMRRTMRMTSHGQ